MLTVAIVCLLLWNAYAFLLAEQWKRELARIERHYWRGEPLTPDPGFVAQLKARVLKAAAGGGV